MLLPLQTHPDVIAAAERLAAADYNALRNLPAERGHLPMGTWPPNQTYGAIRVEAKAHLLCDLSLPESRDWWVRWGLEAQRKRTERQPFDPNMVSRWNGMRDNVARLAESVMFEVDSAT